MWSLTRINTELKAYGRFTVNGMKASEYLRTLAPDWTDVSADGSADVPELDLTRAYTYAELETYMRDLTKREGVRLEVIGQTPQGRNLYSLTLDLPSSETKRTVLLTGQVHAREFAGGLYILKQLGELLRKAETDEFTRLLLENVRFVAVPVVNPDGRELIVDGGSDLRKSNANGVDLNRNFPSTDAAQLIKGATMTWAYRTSPGLEYYAGANLGSETETQAIMGWLHHYVPTATCFVDYHQQGHILYGGKIWDTAAGMNRHKAFALDLEALLREGSPPDPYAYDYSYSHPQYYGLDGGSGSVTDYVTSLADGLKFSIKYGRLALDANGVEKPQLVFKGLSLVPQFFQPLNTGIRIASVEIGRGPDALGYDAVARSRVQAEYALYHFDRMLDRLARYALGPTRVAELEAEAGITPTPIPSPTLSPTGEPTSTPTPQISPEYP